MSERFGQLASPQASGCGSEEWKQVEKVISVSWIRLMDLKCQYYQAQMHYRLAVTLISIALQEKPYSVWWESASAAATPPIDVVGPLPPTGLYSDDGFSDIEINNNLCEF